MLSRRPGQAVDLGTMADVAAHGSARQRNALWMLALVVIGVVLLALAGGLAAWLLA
jgi:hypothetical protein